MERDATKIRGFGERDRERNSVREEAEETGIGEQGTGNGKGEQDEGGREHGKG